MCWKCCGACSARQMKISPDRLRTCTGLRPWLRRSKSSLMCLAWISWPARSQGHWWEGGVVGGLVVGADDVAHHALPAGAQARAAMAADVVEGRDLHFVVAHDQDRIAAQVDRDVVPGIGNLRLDGNEDPVLAEDMRHVDLVQRLAQVERGLQAVTGAAPGQQFAHQFSGG